MEGEKLLSGALDTGVEVEALFVASGGRASPVVGRLLDRAASSGVRVFELAPGVVERIADTVTPQSVLGVVRTPRATLEDLASATFVIVCVDVRDPGNAGAVIRVADAAGADGVVCCEGTVDPFNPKTVRASAGSVLHLPLVVGGGPEETLQVLGSRGMRRLAAVAHGGVPHTGVDLALPVALVLGNEAAGLPERLRSSVDGQVTVPMAGRAESLNVSMAAAVLCFEVVRRRSNLPLMERAR
ncbi:MAG: RNA methyltransferase [Acidimicrobiales bacterium]